jgi:hypothetical protein
MGTFLGVVAGDYRLAAAGIGSQLARCVPSVFGGPTTHVNTLGAIYSLN